MQTRALAAHSEHSSGVSTTGNTGKRQHIELWKQLVGLFPRRNHDVNHQLKTMSHERGTSAKVLAGLGPWYHEVMEGRSRSVLCDCCLLVARLPRLAVKSFWVCEVAVAGSVVCDVCLFVRFSMIVSRLLLRCCSGGGA